MKNEQTPTMLEDTTLGRVVVAALQNAPEPAVPADFAARVAAKAAQLPPRKMASRARYGRATAIAAMAVLAVTLFALAPHTAATVTSISYLMEMLVLLQLGGLSYWWVHSGRES